MSRKALTKEAILKVLEASGATSLSGLYRAMGGGNSIPGSTAKRMRELVPDIVAHLQANKGGKIKGKKAAAEKPKPAVRTSRYPRHPANPYREGSSYALAFDILAAHHGGLSRHDLVELYAKASGKDPQKGARFDLAVVTSPRESATGPRHRSAREGYHVEVVNDHVRLIVSNGKVA